MHLTLTQPQLQCYAPRTRLPGRARSVTAYAKTRDTGLETLQRGAAAVGAALLLASPFAGPAIARPSDFIQSKPSSTPGEPTNVDKFPFSPSVSGQPSRTDTSQITNPQKDPQQFSTTQGLGDALTPSAKGGGEGGKIPSPLDDGPNPDTTGSQGPGLDLNPFK